jgi:tRNA-2-methylthio-N6-dimethylallyladenosine synthase
VPYVRGRERSRNVAAVLNETREAVASGRKTVTFLGQNVNSYRGADADGTPVGFPELLNRAAEIDGDFSLTFMTSHPKDMSQELIEVAAAQRKVSKSVHLPVQSGSDRILSLMNRGYTRAHYLDLIARIRGRMSGAVITSDMIVGFPTETEADFCDTLSLVREARFNNLYMFMYSPRQGTAAAEMDGQIPLTVKRERLKRLIELQRTLQKNIDPNTVSKKCGRGRVNE